jgi:tRNA (cytidine/uridine-2'-O-)-methyltransferase
MKIALINPEIPQNTGNIARLTAGIGVELILVGTIGFSLEDRYLKRAGLDYWDKVNLKVVLDLKEFESMLDKFECSAFISKFGNKLYTEIPLVSSGDTLLVFGNETRGLPDNFHQKYSDFFYRIPMNENIRSLNLSNSVAIVAYDYLRRTGFCSLT